MSSSLLWGVIGYSGATLIIVFILTFWLVSVIKEKYRAIVDLERTKTDLKESKGIIESLEKQESKLRKGLKELRDELEKADTNLSVDGVASRIGELLSQEMPEGKDGKDSDTLPTPTKSDTSKSKTNSSS
jgi:hypothetical protein